MEPGGTALTSKQRAGPADSNSPAALTQFESIGRTVAYAAGPVDPVELVLRMLPTSPEDSVHVRAIAATQETSRSGGRRYPPVIGLQLLVLAVGKGSLS